jgi:hypothetical protein
MSHPIAREWLRVFGEVPPAGFLCRRAFTDRWLRIHSLPESKRYADSESEYRELLSRQNAVATHVLGDATRCLLFITRFGEARDWKASAELPFAVPPEHVLSAEMDGEELQFFASPVVWREGSLNQIIVAVADDRTGPVLFANLDRGSIYAPYDGGADLFLQSPEATVTARTLFEPWLSGREDGL